MVFFLCRRSHQNNQHTPGGNGDVFSVSKTSGFVQTGNQKFVANAAFGESGASGNSVSSDNKAWGSSGNGPSGPNATAGHTVSTNGPMTGYGMF